MSVSQASSQAWSPWSPWSRALDADTVSDIGALRRLGFRLVATIVLSRGGASLGSSAPKRVCCCPPYHGESTVGV